MDHPSESRPAGPHLQRGRWSPSRKERRQRSHGRAPARGQNVPLCDIELDALRSWLAGRAALRLKEAADFLDRSIRHRQLVHEPVAHWRAVKARLAGEANWGPMGFRLILD